MKSLVGLPRQVQFEAIIEDMGEFCPCSCNMGVHRIQTRPDGRGLFVRCDERYHRCPPLPDADPEVLALLPVYFAKRRDRSRSR